MPNILKKSDVVGVSVGSFAFSMLGGLLLLAGAVFSKVRGGELANLLLGKDATVSLIQSSQASILTRVDEALSNDALGRTVVFLAWMFVGLTVYAFITGTVKAAQQLRDVNVRMHMIHQNQTSFSQTLTRELVFRTMVALVWAVFMLICMQLLLPFFLAAVAVVFGESVQTVDWLLALAAFIVIVLALHIQVILARLFFGRVRLFGE